MREEDLLNRLKSQNQNTSFDILNTSSDIPILYRLNSPFQITYEYCSGNDPEDYLNILTLSPGKASYMQETSSLHSYIYRHKAPHLHDYYEFLLVLEGSLYQQIEGQEYLYTEGSCCLINRNLLHKERFCGISRVLFIGLSTDELTRLLGDCTVSCYPEEQAILGTPLSSFIHEEVKRPGRKAYLDFLPTLRNQHPCRILQQLSDHLMRTILLPQFGASHLTRGLLCCLLQYLSSSSDYHCSVVELGNSSDFLLFSHIERLLDENNGRLSRAELAEALHYSGDYLNRIVHKYTGMSLHQYGMKICIKKAAHELTATTDTISSIAYRLSFSNRSYFYRLFYEYYGMSPKEYRKQYSDIFPCIPKTDSSHVP